MSDTRPGGITQPDTAHFKEPFLHKSRNGNVKRTFRASPPKPKPQQQNPWNDLALNRASDALKPPEPGAAAHMSLHLASTMSKSRKTQDA
jgi:hypothetical protein